MNTKLASLVAVGSVFFGGAAYAQEKSNAQAPAPAEKAVEISVGAGYTQSFGDVAQGRSSLADTATAGGAVELGVGYRFVPQLSLGVYGAGAQYTPASALPND